MAFPLSYPERNQEIEDTQNIGSLLDCSEPFVTLSPNDEIVLPLRVTGTQYNEMFAAIMTGAELTYPEKSQELIALFLQAAHCSPELPSENECYDYPSYAPFISYEPTSPFVDNGFSLTYPVAPFFLWSHIDTWLPNWLEDWFFGAIENATGYQENDILISYLSQPLVQNPFNGFDYPEIQIKVNGEGTVRIHLLQVPQGGRAIISVDDPPDLTDLASAVFTSNDRIVELNRDFTSFPPETDVDSIEDIEITGLGVHTIYISFVPTIDFDNALFLQFGGGFRSVELCGFNQTGLIMGITDIRMENCVLEYLLDGTWQAANGFDPLCFKGDTGLQGIQGITGADGVDGIQGIQGVTGTDGIDGIQGIQGIQGLAGVDGTDGLDGTNGLDGGNGDLYPIPIASVGTDAMCEIGGFIVSQLSTILDTIKSDKDFPLSTAITLANLADSHISFDVAALYSLIQNANADGSFAGSVIVDENVLHEEIYCSGYNQAAFVVAALATNSYYSELANCIMPTTWSEWIYIGSLQQQFDCTSFTGCSSVTVWRFDFTSSASGWLPLLGEGNNRATYSAGNGYGQASSILTRLDLEFEALESFVVRQVDVQFSGNITPDNVYGTQHDVRLLASNSTLITDTLPASGQSFFVHNFADIACDEFWTINRTDDNDSIYIQHIDVTIVGAVPTLISNNASEVI